MCTTLLEELIRANFTLYFSFVGQHLSTLRKITFAHFIIIMYTIILLYIGHVGTKYLRTLCDTNMQVFVRIQYVLKFE